MAGNYGRLRAASRGSTCLSGAALGASDQSPGLPHALAAVPVGPHREHAPEGSPRAECVIFCFWTLRPAPGGFPAFNGPFRGGPRCIRPVPEPAAHIDSRSLRPAPRTRRKAPVSPGPGLAARADPQARIPGTTGVLPVFYRGPCKKTLPVVRSLYTGRFIVRHLMSPQQSLGPTTPASVFVLFCFVLFIKLPMSFQRAQKASPPGECFDVLGSMSRT